MVASSQPTGRAAAEAGSAQTGGDGLRVGERPRVGDPSDGDGEGLRMGKSTLSKVALCSISFPIRMHFK